MANAEARYTHKSNRSNPDKKEAESSERDGGPVEGKIGEMAARHTKEHSDMASRHEREHHDMVVRHHDERKQMLDRHSKELGELAAPGEEAAKSKAESSAGSPKELGKSESEGKKGSEP